MHLEKNSEVCPIHCRLIMVLIFFFQSPVIICFVNCRFFSYSLDERIIPRHKILVANRVNFKLRYMLSGSDEEFNQRVQFAIEKRKRFESGYANLDASDDESSHVVPVASS